jgi:hypothetical protein
MDKTQEDNDEPGARHLLITTQKKSKDNKLACQHLLQCNQKNTSKKNLGEKYTYTPTNIIGVML